MESGYGRHSASFDAAHRAMVVAAGLGYRRYEHQAQQVLRSLPPSARPRGHPCSALIEFEPFALALVATILFLPAVPLRRLFLHRLPARPLLHQLASLLAIAVVSVGFGVAYCPQRTDW
uniref:Uncharacterized protein n=1 Tax=Alexandrium catenella TaxID=2925 RepID=A0A7S1WAC3_ALECA